MGTKILKQSLQQADRAVLISIKPRFVEKILSGEKVLEFRRVWAASAVDTLVIYSSSPVQRIVAVARVNTTHSGSPTFLWKLAKEMGGGVSRRQLYEYFRGKRNGFAIELGNVQLIAQQIDPCGIFPKFRPPQSYCYLNQDDYGKIESAIS